MPNILPSRTNYSFTKAHLKMCKKLPCWLLYISTWWSQEETFKSKDTNIYQQEPEKPAFKNSTENFPYL